MRVLIVGGDSLIGRALAAALRASGHEVTPTSYRRPLPRGARYLDLSNPDHEVTAGFDCIVLCAAVVTRAACEADPALAHAVNVLAPLALAKPVLARSAQVVFLSTSVVLGGDAPHLPVDSPYAPFDAYSSQKAEAEQRLRALPGAEEALSILRLVKVLDASYGVVAEWAKAIEKQQAITPFSDLVTAPITVDNVTAKLDKLIARRQMGIHHLSGVEHTYADVAFCLGEALGWPDALIKPIGGRERNAVAAQNPNHASLAANPLIPFDDVIRKLAQQISQ
ncbi:MAG: sugar nucleotide-binding protein [Pseudomonadota bacterium]